MEPITLIAGAILSQFQTSTLIGSIVGGSIGNASYDFFNYSTNKLYKKLRNNIGEPTNHDIQRAVRQSFLKATLIAINHVQSNYKWHQKFTNNNSLLLSEIQNYLQKELNLLNSKDVRFPATDFDKEYQALLFPEANKASNQLSQMILKFKECVLYEIEHNGCAIDIDFKNAVLKGWSDKNKNIDWYELTCAFFTEELKTNSRLSTIIQTEYLEGISKNLNGVNISFDKVKTHLENIYEEYKDLLSKVDEILNTVTRTEEKIDKLPKAIRVIVEEELKKKGTTTEIPDFNLPGRHQKLLTEIQRMDNEQEQTKIEIEDLKIEIQEAKEGNKERKQRMLNRAETSFIEIAQQKQQTETELQDFISNVLKLAKQFEQQPGVLTPRLEKARAFFNDGKYEEADKILNEKEIYDDIKRHKEKAEELSNELTIKAQTTLINKLPNWFEQANKFYKDAAVIYESYGTCFNYAYFLAEHRQVLEAAAWYEKNLLYVINEYQKLAILNNLAILQEYKNEFDKAEISYNEALKISRQLVAINPKIYLSYVAITLNNLASLLKNKNEFDKAEASYNEALYIYRILVVIYPQTYLSKVATIVNNLGVLQKDKNEFNKAEASYNEALTIYKQLAEINPQIYLSDMAMLLNNLANLLKDKNEFDKAAAAYNEALAIYRQLAEINPQTYLFEVATILNNLAVLQTDKNEFDKAESCYNEALTIYKQLAEINPKTYLPDVAMLLNNLASLLKDKNEFDKAEVSYKEALTIRRQLAAINPKTYLPDVAITLNNQANLLKDKNEFDKAEVSYNEALAISRQLTEINPKKFLIDYANTVINLASFYQASIINKEKSIFFAKEAIEAFTPFSDTVLFSSKQKKIAEEILKYWK